MTALMEVVRMAEQNIVMKQLNNAGEYDTLYPATVGQQISGLTFSMVGGNLDASRVTGLPTSLPANGGNADTVGGQSVEEIIAQCTKISYGTYTGTGQYGSFNQTRIDVDFEPKLLFVRYLVNQSGGTGVNYAYIMAFKDNGGSIISRDSNDYGRFVGLAVQWGNNYVTWYASSSTASYALSYQCNQNGLTYGYVVLG